MYCFLLCGSLSSRIIDVYSKDISTLSPWHLFSLHISSYVVSPSDHTIMCETSWGVFSSACSMDS